VGPKHTGNAPPNLNCTSEIYYLLTYIHCLLNTRDNCSCVSKLTSTCFCSNTHARETQHFLQDKFMHKISSCVNWPVACSWTLRAVEWWRWTLSRQLQQFVDVSHLSVDADDFLLQLTTNKLNLQGDPKTTGTLCFVHLNFVKYWPIFKLFSLSESRDHL